MIYKIPNIENVYNKKTNRIHKCVKCLRFEKYLIAAELKIVIGAMYVIDSFSSNPVQLYSQSDNFLYFYDCNGKPKMVEKERAHLIIAELDSNEIVQISVCSHTFDTLNFYLEVNIDCEKNGIIPRWINSFYILKRPFTLMLPGDPITIKDHIKTIGKNTKTLLWKIKNQIENIL
jgi:hypothetical protein